MAAPGSLPLSSRVPTECVCVCVWGGGGDVETSTLKHLSYVVPQGSVLGEFLFTIYTMSLVAILKRRVVYHKFADDLQLVDIYYPSKSGDQEAALALLSACISDIFRWMMDIKLKPNSEKD